MKNKDWTTRLVHVGRDPRQQHGLVNTPVYHGSTVLFPTVADLERAAADPFTGVYYGRFGTPTHFALQEAIADLTGADGAVVVSSGQAAITVSLMSVLRQGDHLLMVDSVYGPTRIFCDTLLKAMGVGVTYFDPMIGADLTELIRSNTRAVFLESPGSLTFEMPDVPTICEIAHAHDAVVLMDNTWATPLLFRPLTHGVDICIHSATKYIVGHADAMLGLIIANGERYRRIRQAAVTLGNCAGPDDCYLALRGLRTLAVRLRQHEANALALVEWLQQRPEVHRVLHPVCPAHPGHDYWRRDFDGASGLFGLILKPCDHVALSAMLDGLELFGMGYSWGGFESLILPTHPEKLRTAVPWRAPGPTLRIHAGLDAVDDLKCDLSAGFERLARY